MFLDSFVARACALSLCTALLADAQAVAPAATDGTPRLMGMNIGAKHYHEPAYIEALSRLDIAILGFHPGWRGDRGGNVIGRVVRDMRARNPAILIGQYTILNESSDDLVRSAASRDRIDKLNQEDWWLRNADGDKAAWTRQYGAFDINFTEWSKPDRNGERYPQWLARRDFERYFRPVPEFKIWYFDNVMIRSRVGKADWKREGRNMSSRDAEVEAAYRRGMAAHWQAARRLRPDMLLIGNVDSDLSSPEYRNQLDGAFLEGLMGKSWSLERTQGWGAMMKRYLGVRDNLRPPAVVGFNVAGDPRDLQFMRYALGSCLLGDGYFSFTDEKAGYSSVPWFDEYDLKLGKALEPPPTQAWSNGVYRRRYEKALVLVNPAGVARTVAPGPGWRRFKGAQAPAVNSGVPAAEVTIGARDAIVLVKD
jgi:hypothetical protein